MDCSGRADVLDLDHEVISGAGHYPEIREPQGLGRIAVKVAGILVLDHDDAVEANQYGSEQVLSPTAVQALRISRRLVESGPDGRREGRKIVLTADLAPACAVQQRIQVQCFNRH